MGRWARRAQRTWVSIDRYIVRAWRKYWSWQFGQPKQQLIAIITIAKLKLKLIAIITTVV